MSTQVYNLPKRKKYDAQSVPHPSLFETDISCSDVRNFAEDSKRLVTGGMDADGVLAICLTWRAEDFMKIWFAKSILQMLL